MWSNDARVLVRPASTFRSIAGRLDPIAARTACRRPLFLTVALACAVSLAATGTLTARIAGPAMLYWLFVPAIEALALFAVMRPRRERVPLSRAVDLFFAGHGAWTLLILAIIGLIALSPPVRWWMLLTRVAMAGMAVVVVWSTYIDFCFFRHVAGSRPAAAIRDVAVIRLLTWFAVFSIFASPELTPGGLASELSEAVGDLLR